MLNLVVYLNRTSIYLSIFEWCVWTLKKHKLKRDESTTQNMLTILGSIVKIMGDLHDPLMRTKILTLIMEKSHRAPSITRKVATALIWIW